MSTGREERAKPFWRSVGYLLFSLGWLIVLGATIAVFWLVVVGVADGAIGPFTGTPIGGLVLLGLLGAPTVGYVFYLSPLLTATQALLGLVLLRDSIGARDSDPPLAVNIGHRVPIYAAARPTPLTGRLAAIGSRARLPGWRLLLLAFGLGAASIGAIILLGWN